MNVQRAEQFGEYRIYKIDSNPPEYVIASEGCGWLPGIYADRDTALFACGYVHGGEKSGPLEMFRSRAKAITMEDFPKYGFDKQQ